MQMMSGGPGGGVASSGCSSNNSCGNSSQDVDNAVQQQQQQQHLAAVRSVAGLTPSTSNVMTLNSPLHQHLTVRSKHLKSANNSSSKKLLCVSRLWLISSKME